MENLKVKDNDEKVHRSLTLEEVDKLNELLRNCQAILGVISSLNPEDIEPYENGYITRLADIGIEYVSEAFEFLNNKHGRL